MAFKNLLALLFSAAILVGCGKDADPAPAAAKTVEDAKGLSERATPLREEVDEVAPVRDQVLKNSGQ